MPWTNADGLIVYLAGERRQFDGGEFPSAGSVRTIEWEIPAASLTATANATWGAPWVIVPRNSVIETVELISETALVGGTSVSVGLTRLNPAAAEYDYDGLAQAVTTAGLNANGKKVTLNANAKGANAAGALVGEETTFPAYLTASAAGTYTAGRLIVRVRLYVKDIDQTPTNI